MSAPEMSPSLPRGVPGQTRAQDCDREGTLSCLLSPYFLQSPQPLLVYRLSGSQAPLCSPQLLFQPLQTSGRCQSSFLCQASSWGIRAPLSAGWTLFNSSSDGSYCTTPRCLLALLLCLPSLCGMPSVRQRPPRHRVSLLLTYPALFSGLSRVIPDVPCAS